MNVNDTIAERTADLLLHHTGSHPIAGAEPFVIGNGTTWAIAIVIDGFYSTEADARLMAEHWRDHPYRNLVQALSDYEYPVTVDTTQATP